MGMPMLMLMSRGRFLYQNVSTCLGLSLPDRLVAKCTNFDLPSTGWHHKVTDLIKDSFDGWMETAE